MDKVIHISRVLKMMNDAILNKYQVSFKAWRVGTPDDPERGEVREYDKVYVTSHSKKGTYNILDPFVSAHDMRFRHVHEALIFEFMNKKVIW